MISPRYMSHFLYYHHQIPPPLASSQTSHVWNCAMKLSMPRAFSDRTGSPLGGDQFSPFVGPWDKPWAPKKPTFLEGFICFMVNHLVIPGGQNIQNLDFSMGCWFIFDGYR